MVTLPRGGGSGAIGDRREETDIQRANAGLFCGAALITGFFGLQAGGFFADTVGGAAVAAGLALIVRVGSVPRPFAGLTWRSSVAIAALALFAIWTLGSAAWSHAPGRAVLDFDRAFFYLLILVLFGSIPRGAGRLTALAGGLALGSVVLCAIGLATRLLPALFPTAPDATPDRLSYPLTYSNAVGLLAVEGILLCLALSASPGVPRRLRLLPAAAVPLLGATLLLTFSRGSIAVGILGLVALCATCRTRALLTTLLAAALPTGLAIHSAYSASAVSSLMATGPRAVAQGHRAAVAVALSSAAALALRTILSRWDLSRPPKGGGRHRRRLALSAAVVVIGAGAAAAAAVDLPQKVASQYHRFVSTSELPKGLGRGRLLNPSNNVRLALWRVATDAASAQPIYGHGAGTFQELWNLDRKVDIDVVNAHSLYLEVFAELGLVGLALLVACLVLIFSGVVTALEGVERPIAAGLLAALVSYLLEAAVDWDWQMPVITWWLFAVGGMTLATGSADPGRESSGRRLGSLLAMLSIGVVTILPVQAGLSQLKLDGALRAFTRGDCNAAVGDALRSASDLGSRAEPFEIIGYCDARYGHPTLAITAIQNAINRDPGDWEYRYDMAIVRGTAGLDPRPAAALARALNPMSPLTVSLAKAVRSRNPRVWRVEAARAPLLTPS